MSKELAMCYLVRQQQPELETGGITPPPRLPSVRPRWAGAGAAAVFGGLALAGALLTTPSMAPQAHDARQRGAPLPVAERSTQLPAGGSVQETSLQMDDGVPTSTSDIPKAAAGHCHHGL
jgi:hypothetical protein